MPRERLLKRITLWTQGEDSAAEHDIVVFTQAVLEDLSKLYNTQRGTVLCDEKFGLPNFTSLMNGFSPPELDKIVFAFKEITQKFEPRLKQVSVEAIPREETHGLLRFVVKSTLVFNLRDISVQFNVALQGDGSVDVQLQG